MADPVYTVLIRVPIPRGDFVDPPPVHWDTTKDDALWKILSGAGQDDIDWNQVAERFDVPVDFLLQQVAYLTERHASQVRAQVRKATAAAKGSSAPSPVPGSENQRAASALSMRRDSPMPRTDGSASATPLAGPAESNSTTSSDEDESSPAQSRIIRRPPRFQQQEVSEGYPDDDDDGSEPAFQPYQAQSEQTSAQDLASTLKGEGPGTSKRSAQMQRPGKPREPKGTGPLSPRRTAELAGRSPGGKAKAGSREGSDGTPSMGSSFSDLDDASVTQSALEDALASQMNRGAISSRFSISGAFRSRYAPGSNQYFINRDDEIRSIENPDCYFKFFIDRNPRVCARQRFAFNQAMEDEIHARLEKQGLQKVLLPLGATATEPHVPIFVSDGLESKSRIVLILGEPSQDLGVMAGRVANGPGGIDQGSMVSVVRKLQEHVSSATDPSPPGVIIANPGQLYWWPEGRRSLTVTASDSVPLPSLVHTGRRHVPELNDIPGNESRSSHIRYVWDKVLLAKSNPEAKISVIAIGETCETVTQYLDKPEHWSRWADRLSSMALLGNVYPSDDLTNNSLKDFLFKRTRAYITSGEPLDTGLATPAGNPEECIPNIGCPCFSSGEPCYSELILSRALPSILEYMDLVAETPDFANPPVDVIVRPHEEEVDVEDEWGKLPEEDKPSVSVVDQQQILEQVKKLEIEDRERSSSMD
ncbi:mitochondrial import receptor subunit or translocase domain-containing protein [Purpureocillium lavendulum]|uniref:Autophagy-related protein 29 n=1 Tax=Purpureocillium lavendulum TaxID=1247861 RepID=A0AB34G794_9HYPO|nr:mitochondrial import receptor subunit or translocase domain-containing protein [Purpureocillium lavendulum]